MGVVVGSASRVAGVGVMIVRRALPGGGWEPAAVPSSVEMVRAACAEVGVPCLSLRTNGKGVSWSYAEGSAEILKAARLARLRQHGPDSLTRCSRHIFAFMTCARVTVAEALLYPDMTCGAP